MDPAPGDARQQTQAPALRPDAVCRGRRPFCHQTPSPRRSRALASATIPADDLRKKREAELAQARKEQENIEAAIRQGIITPTTKRMLLETEARIAHLEAALRAEPNRKVAFLPSAVEMCLRDLRGTLGTDPDYARGLLAKLIDSITLRKEGARLFADVRGNITGLLGLDAEYDNRGAGRAFLFERHARVRIA